MQSAVIITNPNADIVTSMEITKSAVNVTTPRADVGTKAILREYPQASPSVPECEADQQPDVPPPE